MKTKATAVLLCVALLLTVSVNVSAQDFNTQTQASLHDIQITPITDEITVNVGKKGSTVITEPTSHIDSSISLMATGATPIGYLDIVNTTTINGWAYQSDIPNTPLSVHIYITNNSTGAQTVYEVLANHYRGDLEAAGYGNGCHGFSYNIRWLTFVPGTYTVTAYAIGVNTGINPQLINIHSYTVRSPQYNIERITSSYIEGWIWKPDAPNDALGVHVYVYKGNGDLYGIYVGPANHYRADLEAAGYGNGCYGFQIPIDFTSMPEERLTFKFHYIDDSGYHPTFYSWYYENRMPITLLGMIDNKGINHSTWMWENNVVSYCNNIGCSQLNRYNYSDATDHNYSYTRFIKESSFCAVATHGYKYGIQWSMRQIYNSHIDCENEYCTTCYGFYTTDILNELPSGYFDNTRCFVSIACETAQGGKTDTTNFVNVLHSKGVETVVGFEEETWFYYNTSTLQTITTTGSFKWLVEFTRLLGEGYTVNYSAIRAYEITLVANLAANGYTMAQYENGDIPEDDLVKKIICGLDSYCIVGNGNQVVKH